MNKNVLSAIGLPLLIGVLKRVQQGENRPTKQGENRPTQQGSKNLEEYLKSLLGISSPEIKVTVSFRYTPPIESWSQETVVYHDFPEHVSSVVSMLQPLRNINIHEYHDGEGFDGDQMFEAQLGLPDAIYEGFLRDDAGEIQYFIEALPNKVSYSYSRTYNDYDVTKMTVEDTSYHLYDWQEDHHLYEMYSQWLQDNNKPNTEKSAFECLDEDWSWMDTTEPTWDNLTEEQFAHITFHFPINGQTLKMTPEAFKEVIEDILNIAEKHVDDEVYTGRLYIKGFELGINSLSFDSSEPHELPVKVVTDSIRRF